MMRSPLMWKRAAVAAAILLAIGAVQAGEDPDAGALMLADQTPTTVEKSSDWRIFVEGAYGGDTVRNQLTGQEASQSNHRLSFDLQLDDTFAPGWRAVLSDRLDVDWPPQSGDQNSINTIREAYLSWQPQSNEIVDFGRINPRYGVATGYNPTDFFRTGAVRSVVSVDPSSLKQNRQGSVMLRGQTLWEGGSLTALYSPKLSKQPDVNDFNPDWGATNNQNRVLVALSEKFNDHINPQFLIYKAQDASTQLGFNLTDLLNDSTVVFVEWSGGHSATLLTQAFNQHGLPRADDDAFRNHLSTGLTYTTGNKISLTGELEYNGAGLDQSDWIALSHGSLPVYGLYRNWLQIEQESPTKPALFFYGMWQDALINHLDLSAMERYDAADYSRLTWLEARYHDKHAEYALQWQRYSGKVWSDYGAAPQVMGWDVVARYYF